MTMNQQIAEEFVCHLKELSRGELAILRRNAGNTLENSRGAMGIFYPLLPSQFLGNNLEETFFLMATLYSINPIDCKEGNFGHTLRALKNSYSENTLDNRFTALLDESIKQDMTAVSHRLRQLTLMARSKNCGMNWQQLLVDLYWWDSTSRRVQKEWARAYFGEYRETDNIQRGNYNAV